MNKKRPVNLNLTTIKFPIMAIASIFHRLSGVILFLLFPFALYFLKLSLINENSFINLKNLLAMPLYKFFTWVFLAAIIYHLIAGIRHIIMDLGCGEKLKQGRLSATVVMFISAILIILLGIWLW